MKFLMLLVFCFGVKADVLQTEPVGNTCTGVGLFDNEEVVTDENNIVQPCREDDYQCMRNFMAENSNCKPACGSVQEPLYLAQTTFYFAYCNLTFTYTNYTTSGLNNTSIMSFYYNAVTKNLVIAIKIPALTIDIPKIIITYRRPGKESIVKSDVANVIFESLIFTATIPKKGKLRLDLADIQHGYSRQSFPDFYIGSAAYTSKDPVVMAEYAGFLANIPTAVQSTLLFHSQFYSSLYIQKFICDFGLDLYTT